jgi:potassium-dependent mechanosensitive channel
MEEKLIALEKEMSSPTYYWDLFLSVWKFEVFAVDGTGVTVGKIFFGLFLLTIGYFFSRFASRLVRQRFLSRLNFDNSLLSTWETLLFYAFYILCCLFVLQLLSIPITVFAVLGGAVAIGFGFGSQNLISNFISGLIVMVERPVRVGDLIELEGSTGRIEQIGTRCTIIRNIENKQVIVPNSKFLDVSFVNWTLSDNLVSSKVTVGVAYNSDVKLVSQLLIQAAASHPRVLKEPAPATMLTHFGDSSLDFEVIYWHPVEIDYGAAAIRSDIRLKILELFEANKVSIPFPHREVIMRNHEPRS